MSWSVGRVLTLFAPHFMKSIFAETNLKQTVEETWTEVERGWMERQGGGGGGLSSVTITKCVGGLFPTTLYILMRITK